MKREDLSTKLKDILRECLLDAALEIDPESNLEEDLGLDSMGVVDLTMHLEFNFNIDVQEDEIVGIETFQDLLVFVSKKMNLA
jgi:acyl carrier protein